MKDINIAIVGVGNCASSLVQLIQPAGGPDPGFAGLMHEEIGGYGVGHVRVVAAFDINRTKIGRDVAEAIFAPPNCTTRYRDVPALGVIVAPGAFQDGIGANLRDVVDIDPVCLDTPADDIAERLKASRADVVVSYLPVGARRDTDLYASASLAAGCAFVNCNPERVASDAVWAERFRQAGLPVLGDDIKSQIGATMLHRKLCQTLLDRGARVHSTYQLNVGGNTDFLNMSDRGRAVSKKFTKSNAIADLLGDAAQINVGPSDCLPLLKDRKVAYIRLEGNACLDMNFSIELRLEVEDSPNSAGVAIDAIRCAQVARDRRLCGAVEEPAPFLFKLPPRVVAEADEKTLMEQWSAL
ncbi:inositol-3-phosphate synthase [Paludibacterium paludis]|uniref:Myo-inositol-1-phosphate synthase n=1 Tax=Paludibacterium paludis TaxID=1225769 RepID=A0A918P157_9NEIS|nr:inositol-3-phosphate synthase [Paludibacterium paludis]GGY11839.1 myo-inositol-1-phosphate synthase [Paludibacterium paludis]